MKMVKLVLPHGDINEKSYGDGRTALMLAAAAGKVEMVKMLIEHGVDLEIKDRLTIFINSSLYVKEQK